MVLLNCDARILKNLKRCVSYLGYITICPNCRKQFCSLHFNNHKCSEYLIEVGESTIIIEVTILTKVRHHFELFFSNKKTLIADFELSIDYLKAIERRYNCCLLISNIKEIMEYDLL